MNAKFIAKIYLKKEEIGHKEGDDIDELYAWMLVRAEKEPGNVHGEISDNHTHEVLRKFRKSPPD